MVNSALIAGNIQRVMRVTWAKLRSHCGSIHGKQGGVNQRGQSLTEFVVVTAVLTAIGILIMDLLTGPSRHNGAIQNVSNHATTAIVNDKD